MRQSWGAFPSLRWVQWSLFAACIVVLWENICFAQSDVPDLSLDQLRAEPLLKDFDWKAYAQIHSDLHVAKITTEFDLRQHYWKSGRFEGRAFPKTVPNEPQAAFALKKIMNFVSFLDKHSVPMQERTLMVFHIGKPDMKNSLEVIINNLHIFQSSIDLDTAGSSGIFYLFNIVDGNENMYFKFLNTSNFNVGWNVWSATPSDIYTHLRTMNIYQDVLLKSFGSIFFLNNGVRGPLLDRAAGKWMQPFRKLLFANNVGMVGSTLSCELAPHIQTHFFGLLTSIIPIVLKEYDAYRTFDTWPALIRYYEVDLTGFIRNSGYNVASLFYQKRIGQQYFQNGTCLKADKFVNDHTVDNPSRWCDIVPEEVMLFKWGGDMLRTNGFICSLTKQRMQDVLVDLSHQMPAKYELEIPETLRGGSYFDLYKQYEHETFRDRLISPEPSTTSSSNSAATSNTAVVSMAASPQGDGRGGKVCFLVRPSVYDLQRPVTSLVNSDYFRGFSNLVQCKQYL